MKCFAKGRKVKLEYSSDTDFFSSTAWLGFVINCEDMTLDNGQKYAIKWSTLLLRCYLFG